MVQHEGAFDEFGMRRHCGDEGVLVGGGQSEILEGGLPAADEIRGGAAESGERGAQFGFGGRVPEVEPHLGRDTE